LIAADISADGLDTGYGIAVDASGAVIVAETPARRISQLRMFFGRIQQHCEGTDAFITKINVSERLWNTADFLAKRF
jgi:hypothetical protein